MKFGEIFPLVYKLFLINYLYKKLCYLEKELWLKICWSKILVISSSLSLSGVKKGQVLIIDLLYTCILTFVMRSVKTRQMLENAKLSFWSHFKAKSEYFPELFNFFSMTFTSKVTIKWWWVVLYCYILVFSLFQAISQNVVVRHPMGFSQIASHLSKQGQRREHGWLHLPLQTVWYRWL